MNPNRPKKPNKLEIVTAELRQCAAELRACELKRRQAEEDRLRLATILDRIGRMSTHTPFPRGDEIAVSFMVSRYEFNFLRDPEAMLDHLAEQMKHAIRSRFSR